MVNEHEQEKNENKDITNKLALIDYQVSKEKQFAMGISFSQFLITISSALLVLLPYFSKERDVFIKTVILTCYLFVIILGIIHMKLDYKQLIEFQKKILGRESQNYTNATKHILDLSIMFFIIASIFLFALGVKDSSREVKMKNKNIICLIQEKENVPTGDSLEDTIIHKIEPNKGK